MGQVGVAGLVRGAGLELVPVPTEAAAEGVAVAW